MLVPTATEPPQTATPPIQRLLAAEVYTAFETTPVGLTQDEARRRLARYGPNRLAEARTTPLVVRFAANFTHLMALLLWAGGVIALIAQLPQLAIAIWAVNLINGAFSFWQEYKAERATEALRRLLPVNATVLRNGEQVSVPAEELVPGDIMLLAEGGRISADGRLVSDSELFVDQSTLTGESNPVRKLSLAMQQEGEGGLAALPQLVFAGTSVVSGAGKAVVFATGMKTEFGRIAHLTQTLTEELSPLQEEMKLVTRVVTLIAVGVGIVVFLLGLLLAKMNLAEVFIFSLGMIVAFVPEGLLPTVTLALAMGVQRMARRNALVKRLSSVETLGCTTVICTDKTGTLTQNEMTVREIWQGGHRYSVSGIGYEPAGRLKPANGAPAPEADSDVLLLLKAAALCSNARLIPPDASEQRWHVLGDPTEAALKVACVKGGVDLEALEGEQPRLRELPFESRRKRMSTIHRSKRERVAYVKGAPREVLALCRDTLIQGRVTPLDPDTCRQIMEANDGFARAGLRVLAVAYRTLQDDETIYSPEAVERDLTFLGLFAMMDPPRPEVKEAVEKCHRAGIKVIMITGDYGLTAESIARRIGIIRSPKPRIITGAELDRLDNAALREALASEVIFARVAPEHKMRVVSTLQDMGEIVAVTGDGVNDAPALKRANIGIAMGISGTDVAKETADIILTDDNFASIVSAVEEGRGVYANIKKFTTYIFTSNTPEAVPFILYVFSGGLIPLALTVMQILSVDLGTDLVPALALGAEPPEPGLMDRPPRRVTEHVITKGLLARAYLWLGLFQSLAAMLAFYFHYWVNGYAGQWTGLPADGDLYRSATAMTLAAIVATQIGNLFAQRTERESVLRVPLFNNRLIWVGIATEVLLILLIVYVPFLQAIFDTAAFPASNWLFLLLLVPVLVLADELRKLALRRRFNRNRKVAQ